MIYKDKDEDNYKDKVLRRPITYYIFEKLGVQGYQIHAYNDEDNDQEKDIDNDNDKDKDNDKGNDGGTLFQLHQGVTACHQQDLDQGESTFAVCHTVCV